ncbi:unknown [Bacteroides sp. CAG:598]|nr:unknown [Bacteroides sp. CAG:598]
MLLRIDFTATFQSFFFDYKAFSHFLVPPSMAQNFSMRSISLRLWICVSCCFCICIISMIFPFDYFIFKAAFLIV